MKLPTPDTRMHDDARDLESLMQQLTRIAAAFLAGNADAPVVDTAYHRPAFDDTPPEHGVGAQRALADYWAAHRDAHSRSTGPRYFGFVTGGVTPAALAADWLVSVLDQNVATERHSVAAFIETQALRQLARMLRLDGFAGLLTTGATAANLVGLATAREWCGEQLGRSIAREGLRDSAAIEVIGCAPHSSIVKVLGLLGLGQQQLTRVRSLPGREAVDVDALSAALDGGGGRPRIVLASAGTVDSGDFDALPAVAALCRRHGAWLHVDAAFGGFARLSPRYAALAEGLDLADSVTLDAHKWLNVPYDCGIAFTRHPALQERAFSAAAPYVPLEGDLPAYMNRGIEQSRRFRALPLHLSLQAYGRRGFEELVERHCRFAQQLGTWMQSHPLLRLLAPVRLNIVLFCAEGDSPSERDRSTRALLKRVNSSGRLFLTPTTYRGQAAIRLAISNWSTAPQDIDIAVSTIHTALLGLVQERAGTPSAEVDAGAA